MGFGPFDLHALLFLRKSLGDEKHFVSQGWRCHQVAAQRLCGSKPDTGPIRVDDFLRRSHPPNGIVLTCFFRSGIPVYL